MHFTSRAHHLCVNRYFISSCISVHVCQHTAMYPAPCGPHKKLPLASMSLLSACHAHPGALAQCSQCPMCSKLCVLSLQLDKPKYALGCSCPAVSSPLNCMFQIPPWLLRPSGRWHLEHTQLHVCNKTLWYSRSCMVQMYWPLATNTSKDQVW